MQRIFITALACLVSVSSYGQNELTKNNNEEDTLALYENIMQNYIN